MRTQHFIIRSTLCVISFSLIGFLLYANVLNGEFVSDDYPFLVNNYLIRNIGDVYEIWESFPTRFLLMYSYALNYSWGGLNVFGYHLVNVLIHIVNTCLVCLLLALLLKTAVHNQAEKIPNKFFFAYCTALIFLCHPMQTQAVSYIAQRGTTLSAFFYLLTVIFYIKSRINNFYYYLSILSMYLGALSKENIVTAPVLIFFYEVFLNGMNRNGIVPALKRLVPYFLAVVLVFFFLQSEKRMAMVALKQQLAEGYFSWNYFLTEINVLISYLRLFILPLNQSHVYDYPISPGLGDVRTVFSLACFTILILLIRYFYCSKKRLLGFFILWFFVALSVEFICVTFVHLGVMYDHWFYLASIGPAFIAVYSAAVFLRDRKSLGIIVILVLSSLCFLTVQRNQVWTDEVFFWQDVIKKAPNDYTGQQYLALALFRKGRGAQALQMSLKILQRNPNDTQILNNIGIYYLSKGNPGQALRYLKRAIEVNPDCYPGYNNIADIYQRNGQCEEAVGYYERSIQINPQSPTAYYHLGKCYINLGQEEKAERYLRQAKDLYQKRHQTDKIEAIDRLRYEGP